VTPRLRDYQNAASEAALKVLTRGPDPLLAAPTVSGRSLMVAELFRARA
jgi:hypothetical protein